MKVGHLSGRGRRNAERGSVLKTVGRVQRQKSFAGWFGK